MIKSFFAFLLIVLSSNGWGYTPPALTGPVVDQAQIITNSQKQRLELQIRHLFEQSGIQLQVLTLDSLQGNTIEQVSIDTVEKWQLGSKEKDNGLLFLVAPKEKKVRIEVGQGLEGDIPDIIAHQIIQQKILPHFKKGQYGLGLISGVSTVEALVAPGTAKETRKSLTRNSHPAYYELIKILFIFGVFILISLTGGRGRRSGASGFLLGALLGSMGGGRHSGGGFGGWSGGGGGFSGGGASGGW